MKTKYTLLHRATFIAAAGAALSACAHNPGKWERAAVQREAPDAIIADAAKCDDANTKGCMEFSVWLNPKDPAAAVEVMMVACNQGFAGACTMAEGMKRASQRQ